LNNHPQVVEAKSNLLGTEARNGLALANYYPQVNFAADWNKGRTYFAAQENIKTTEVNTAALYVKQTIYDFGRTSWAVDAAHSNYEAAEKALVITRQDLSLRVRSAFYLLLAAEKQVAAVTETVKARSEVLRQAQEFFIQGIRAKVDVARAEANFYTAKTSLIRAENNREIARLELANAMGIMSLGILQPIEPSAAPGVLPEKSIVQQTAMLNRTELHQLADFKAVAASNLKTAKGSYLPTLSGTANVGYADRDIPPAGNVWGVGLNLSVPLFSGFSSVEQIKEATSTINAIEAKQSNLRLQISKEVESAWLGANEASARIASTDKEVSAAGESKALAEARYIEGVGNIIEVSDSQTQTLDAQTANIQARYDYYVALARLNRAVGSEVAR
jgi:outer membrane protein TolC